VTTFAAVCLIAAVLTAGTAWRDRTFLAIVAAAIMAANLALALWHAL
jgi:hypothetical protein